MFEDIFFLNANEALRVAFKQNRTSANLLQICYYTGEKIESELVNLIHLPFENFVDNLSKGTYRLPTKIDFTGLELSSEIKLDITNNFTILLEQAQQFRNEFNIEYVKAFKNAKLNFHEPLRFYLVASSNTNVMQYITKNLVDTIKDMGYNVLFDLQTGIEDTECLKTVFLFNPHIIININHLNNHSLNDDILNFIWFQDVMPSLTNNSNITLRKNDFVFHLTLGIKNHLLKHDIQSIYQPFCVNTKLYKNREEIQRVHKIVFIGSSYKRVFDTIENNVKYEICDYLLKEYLNNGYMQQKDRATIVKKYDIDSFILGQIFNYVERDLLLKYIINLDLDIKIELYGYGWDLDDEFKQYNQGVLPYGKEISKVYNSAKYTLVLGGYVLQQRTLEAAASGTIPLVFDVRKDNDENDKCFNESLIFFKTPDELSEILTQNVKKELECIVNEHSYKKFVTKILKIANEKISEK